MSEHSSPFRQLRGVELLEVAQVVPFLLLLSRCTSACGRADRATRVLADWASLGDWYTSAPRAPGDVCSKALTQAVALDRTRTRVAPVCPTQTTFETEVRRGFVLTNLGVDQATERMRRARHGAATIYDGC